MKILLAVVFAVFGGVAFGQVADKATAIYASNGTLIGLSNLSGLSECASRSADGKVRDLKFDGDVATFRLKKKKEESAEIRVDLGRVPESDRPVARRDLIRKSNMVRVSGYACGTDGEITAFSLDRVY